MYNLPCSQATTNLYMACGRRRHTPAEWQESHEWRAGVHPSLRCHRPGKPARRYILFRDWATHTSPPYRNPGPAVDRTHTSQTSPTPAIFSHNHALLPHPWQNTTFGISASGILSACDCTLIMCDSTCTPSKHESTRQLSLLQDRKTGKLSQGRQGALKTGGD